VGERRRADQRVRLAHREVLPQQHARGRAPRRRTTGIVFAPGGAGTMQEVFQDAVQNADRVFGHSPMAFLDTGHYRVETGLYRAALERQTSGWASQTS
jgi:predicted Rossmann-fold nucleotide-binding protein